LLAALRDPLIILVCIAPIPLLGIYYKLANAVQRRAKSRWLSGSEKQRPVGKRMRGRRVHAL